MSRYACITSGIEGPVSALAISAGVQAGQVAAAAVHSHRATRSLAECDGTLAKSDHFDGGMRVLRKSLANALSGDPRI